MLDTILSWIYTILNWFRSPLRQIPTEVTEGNMEHESTAPQREEQASAAEGVATHEPEGLSRRVPAHLHDDDIHLDDPPNPQPALNPVLMVGGPSVAGGSITASPVLPEKDVTEQLEVLDHATLAARSQLLNKDSDVTTDEEAAVAVAPPPSAVAETIDKVDDALASEILEASPGPVLVPEILAEKLKVGSGEEGTDKEEVSCSQKEEHST